jgi:hypothetical protein
MLLEKVESGKKYNIHWMDGDFKTNCLFIKKHRNFFIFLDENHMKVICHPSSIKEVVYVFIFIGLFGIGGHQQRKD